MCYKDNSTTTKQGDGLTVRIIMGHECQSQVVLVFESLYAFKKIKKERKRCVSTENIQ